jgi:hypothetical protein
VNIVLKVILEIAIFCFCLFLLFVLASCATPDEITLSRPPCNWRIWAGNPGNASIERTQDKLRVSCQDPAFDKYVCLSTEDLKNLLECGGSGK